MKTWKTMLKQDRVALAAALTLGLICVFALIWPLVSPYGPREIHADDALSGPSAEYWLGTDDTGRDMLTLLAHGARISLGIAVAAEILAVLSGIPLAMIAGLMGGIVDSIVMRTTDALLGFPGILIGLMVVALFGASLPTLMIAIALMTVPYLIRVVRNAVVVEKQRLYVLSSTALGVKPGTLLGRTILPNIVSPLIVQVSFGLAVAILTEASLGFLGLSVQPPAASWGTLLQVGYSYIRITPWLVTFPGILIFVSVWALNTLGDAGRDVLDPRLRDTIDHGPR